LWLSQIQQGLAIKYAVEHWRQNMPRCMGAIYWQLNDCWPVASWASIDSLNRWKALHFMAKRFYEPLMVSGVEDNDKGTVAVHVTSDLGESVSPIVQWTLTSADGKHIKSGKKTVTAAHRQSKCVMNLNLKPDVKKHTAENLMLWLELKQGTKIVSRNFVTFARPKHLELKDPKIKTTVRKKGDNTFVVTLSVKHPALWAWLELKGMDASYSDNFMCIQSGRKVPIEVTPKKKLSLIQFKKKLKASSLHDTYSS
jgi:beta-mannosidase